jgi:hypothetical protein
MNGVPARLTGTSINVMLDRNLNSGLFHQQGVLSPVFNHQSDAHHDEG